MFDNINDSGSHNMLAVPSTALKPLAASQFAIPSVFDTLEMMSNYTQNIEDSWMGGVWAGPILFPQGDVVGFYRNWTSRNE